MKCVQAKKTTASRVAEAGGTIIATVVRQELMCIPRFQAPCSINDHELKVSFCATDSYQFLLVLRPNLACFSSYFAPSGINL